MLEYGWHCQEFALRFPDGIEKMRDLVVRSGRWSAAMRVQ
jgi:hypothetical protein